MVNVDPSVEGAAVAAAAGASVAGASVAGDAGRVVTTDEAGTPALGGGS